MRNSIAPFYDVYTAYNLPFNSNCRILSAQLNFIFTPVIPAVIFKNKLLNSEPIVPLILKFSP